MSAQGQSLYFRCFLSFGVAFSGLIYEFLLAYFLSLTLGGTFLRFAVTVGLFTLTLGAAALVFDLLPTRFKTKTYFLRLQFLIALVALLSPLWIRIMDPLAHPAWPSALVSILCHLPVVAIGLLTGFELPFLFQKVEPVRQNAILACDYIGMFTASLLFPLLLFPYLGLFPTLYLTVSVNVLIALLSWWKMRTL